MKKIKGWLAEWFDDLPFAITVGFVCPFLTFLYIRKLVTGRNALSDLASLMEPARKDLVVINETFEVNGISELVITEAKEGEEGKDCLMLSSFCLN